MKHVHELRQFKAQLLSLKIQAMAQHKGLLVEIRSTGDEEIRRLMQEMIAEASSTITSIKGELRTVDKAIGELVNTTFGWVRTPEGKVVRGLVNTGGVA